MNVAVVNLTGGNLSGGYRKYLTTLMPLLAADRRISRLVVFVPDGVEAMLGTGLDVRRWHATMLAAGGSELKRQISAAKPDVVFIPTARFLHCGSTPVVVMVRNMEPLSNPLDRNSLFESVKNIARAQAARRACTHARLIIAVSQFVRDFIIRRWSLDAARVTTIYHGVRVQDRAFHAATLPGTPFFTAGSIRPGRGLEDVISALAQTGGSTRLMIAGRADPGLESYEARLRQFAERQHVADRVVWRGQLDAAEMAEAFRSCTAFVMTSRAEACPNAALEAMSYGCASVASDTPPMPEFFGESALYYTPGDATSLAAQLRVLGEQPGLRDDLGRLAQHRATRFSWEETRDRTIEALAQAAS